MVVFYGTPGFLLYEKRIALKSEKKFCYLRADLPLRDAIIIHLLLYPSSLLFPRAEIIDSSALKVDIISCSLVSTKVCLINRRLPHAVVSHGYALSRKLH